MQLLNSSKSPKVFLFPGKQVDFIHFFFRILISYIPASVSECRQIMLVSWLSRCLANSRSKHNLCFPSAVQLATFTSQVIC